MLAKPARAALRESAREVAPRVAAGKDCGRPGTCEVNHHSWERPSRKVEAHSIRQEKFPTELRDSATTCAASSAGDLEPAEGARREAARARHAPRRRGPACGLLPRYRDEPFPQPDREPDTLFWNFPTRNTRDRASAGVVSPEGLLEAARGELAIGESSGVSAPARGSGRGASRGTRACPPRRRGGRARGSRAARPTGSGGA